MMKINLERMIDWSKKELKRRGLKRIGECNKCGKCCSLGTLGFKINNNCELTEVIIDRTQICEKFDRKTNKCKDYDGNGYKCLICPTFPMLPEHLKYIKKYCGYRFVKE